MRKIVFALCAATLLPSFEATAGQPTDFSGVWQMDLSRSDSAHQGTPIGPVTLIIREGASELSIETRRREKDKPSAEVLLYMLDGSEKSNTGNAGGEIVTKARWNGTKLVAETIRDVHGATVTTTHVLSLDASGKELTIDKTLTVQHGYQFQGANNTGRGKDIFIKRKRLIKR